MRGRGVLREVARPGEEARAGSSARARKLRNSFANDSTQNAPPDRPMPPNACHLLILPNPNPARNPVGA
jgi:hypothetical protein